MKNDLIALFLAPMATTGIVSIAAMIRSHSIASGLWMALWFGLFCFIFTFIFGLPAHVVFSLLKVKSIIVYMLFGFLAGMLLVPFLSKAKLDERNITAALLLGALGSLNSSLFILIKRKITQNQRVEPIAKTAVNPLNE